MLKTSVHKALGGDVPVHSTIMIQGWVRTRRDSKAGFSFVQIHDGSCFDALQVVVDQKIVNYETEIKQLTVGCAVAVSGELVESPGKKQQVELRAKSLSVIGWVDEPESYALAAKHHSLEHLRDNAHLRPRSNTFGAISRIRQKLAVAIHNYFDEKGFVWVNTPIITTSDCEGAGDLFRVSKLDLANRNLQKTGPINGQHDFFGSPTYLTVSGQLNLECYCLALSKVYTFGPAFRAENSNTSRHLAEFWMIEPEIAFADLRDNADLAENLLQTVARELMEHCQKDLEFFNKRHNQKLLKRLSDLVNTQFERIDYTHAIKILKKSNYSFEFEVAWGLDLQSEHERYLTEKYFRKPVIVMNYPKDIKAFYMRLNDDNKTVAAMDVLVPGMGEIIGGSQREERLTVLDARITNKDVRKELWWYRELRRYGTVPHSGFGLGFERFLGYVTGMDNVRDLIPFPRTPKSAPF